jgi:hypothetical protein
MILFHVHAVPFPEKRQIADVEANAATGLFAHPAELLEVTDLNDEVEALKRENRDIEAQRH